MNYTLTKSHKLSAKLQGIRMGGWFLATSINPATRACSKKAGFIMQRFCFIGGFRSEYVRYHVPVIPQPISELK